MRCLTALAALLLLAGCAAPAVETPTPAPAAAHPALRVVDAGARCATFCEPTIAVVPSGEWFLTSGGRLMTSSDEGASFEELPMPPFPTGGAGGRGDGLVSVAPDGTLFYTALMAACVAAPCALQGIDVARSSDLGRTWESSYLSAPLHADAAGADRQWLVFGPDGIVCLHFQFLGPANLLAIVPEGHELRVSCSTDGGATFPPFVSASPPGEVVVNGQGLFAADGRLHVPYFTTGALHIATSEDAGRTFSSTLVDGARGSMFPALAQSSDGRLHLGWRSETEQMQYTTSADGGATWAAPALLGDPNERVPTGPWFAARGGTPLVVWFAERSDDTLRLAAWEGGAPFELARDLEPSATSRAPATDFPHAALTADGRALVPFGDVANETTQVAIVR